VTANGGPAGGAQVETWVRYTHLDKSHGYLPGMGQAQPAVFGLTAQEYAAVRAHFAENAEAAARLLLTDPDLAAKVDRLPFRDGDTVLAVGDSLTDDLQSWAEILRGVLDLRSRADVRVINRGLSAHTTAMILRSWPATVAAVRPAWVICCLGGNDVTRVGPSPAKCQVSLAESLANLTELRRITAALTGGRWVWMTPTTVREERVEAFPAFRFGQSSWSNADVHALADGIRGLGEPIVDLTKVMGTPAAAELVDQDGVHPTLAGQAAIARAVIEALAE
jgi:lysophospholipase L1-like esterase